jgi:hypothetical protein
MTAAVTPNHDLRAARKALVSPSGSERPMSRQELADACNAELERQSEALGRRGRWAGITEKTIGALERGEVRWPNEDYRRALCTVLQADERSLGLYIDRPGRTEEDEHPRSTEPDFSRHSQARLPAGRSDKHDPDQGSPFGQEDLEWSIDQSADQALIFASSAAAGLDAQSTDDLFSRVADIAQGYASQDRWRTFNRAKYLRDVAFDQATRTKRPDNLADLYLLSALNSLLMASAAFDLGRASGALRLAQAARTLAGLSRHTEAEASSVGLIATLFNWRNRPDEALVEIGRASRLTSSGKELFRLMNIKARSFALRGDRGRAEGALKEAQLCLAGANSSSLLHDQIAGEFGFDSARASACAGAAWLHLGDGAAARPYLETAIGDYQALPERQQPWAPLTGAQVDLATACVMSRDLDAAAAAIEPVFGLEEGQRISTITGRVASTLRQLRTPGYESDRQARQLGSRIEGWSMEFDQRSIGFR